MGPNVIYLLPCALGVVLRAACSLEVPGDGLLLPFVPGQWEDWGIKTCIWMGLANVAVLANVRTSPCH